MVKKNNLLVINFVYIIYVVILISNYINDRDIYSKEISKLTQMRKKVDTLIEDDNSSNSLIFEEINNVYLNIRSLEGITTSEMNDDNMDAEKYLLRYRTIMLIEELNITEAYQTKEKKVIFNTRLCLALMFLSNVLFLIKNIVQKILVKSIKKR